eukprot:scaffold6212_cov76-Skeletonema_marinoi.AAC.1
MLPVTQYKTRASRASLPLRSDETLLSIRTRGTSNQAASRFRLDSTSTNSQLPPSDALALQLQPPTKRITLNPSMSAVLKSRRNDQSARDKAGIATLEAKYGESIQELCTSHRGNNIDFTVDRFRLGAEEMNIPPECLVNASTSTKVNGVKPAAPINALRGDSKYALPQQNGQDLTAAKFLKAHNNAVNNGTSCAYGGFTRGSLGTKMKQNGTIVDAASSKASAAQYADGVVGIVIYNEERGLDTASLIPRLVHEDLDGDLYGTFFIGKNNQRLDHTNKSKEEFKEMVEHEAVGFETRDAEKFDSLLLRIDSEQKEKAKKAGNKKAKKAGNKKAKKAGNKKKISGVERKNMVKRFTTPAVAMRFVKERFDEKGIVDTTKFGPTSNRRKSAGYRFTIMNDDTSFKFN